MKHTGQHRVSDKIGMPFEVDSSMLTSGEYYYGARRRKPSRNGATIFSVAVFIAFFAVVCAISQLVTGHIGIGTLIVALVVALLGTSSMHIVLEWEKAVILRLGKFNRVRGPGLFFTIPLIEYMTIKVDQRVVTTFFAAEETLTSDLVPINVDAVLFWMVWNAKNACMEVEDYSAAVAWVAQTSMRKAIGRASVAEVAMRRDQLDEELKEVIEQKLSPWGITIIDVEIRDIVIPKELQEVMSLEAQAERQKNARMTLAEAEKDISEMLVDAGEMYNGNENAMKLRTMHLAYESVKGSGGTLVIPSAFSEGFTESLSDNPDTQATPGKAAAKRAAKSKSDLLS